MTGEPGSIQAYILGDIQERQEQEVQKLPIPRFNGRLMVRYRPIDSRTLIRIGIEAEKNPDEVEGVIQASVAALLASCEGTETEINGETVDLGKRLGRELAEYFEMEEIYTDEEAVYALFDDEIAIVNTANKLRQFQQMANEKITEDIVGN